MTKFLLWTSGVLVLIVVSLALVWYALVVDLALFSIPIVILTGIAFVFVAQMVREDRDEWQTKVLLDASRVELAEELRRNFCTADLFPESLLSPKVWDGVVESGLALRFPGHESKPLWACYSAIGFYNHDVSNGNLGAAKQDRVKDFISEALSSIKNKAPTLQECCKEILQRWATKEKLDEACARRQSSGVSR